MRTKLFNPFNPNDDPLISTSNTITFLLEFLAASKFPENLKELLFPMIDLICSHEIVSRSKLLTTP